jgi:hypothetical protein
MKKLASGVRPNSTQFNILFILSILFIFCFFLLPKGILLFSSPFSIQLHLFFYLLIFLPILFISINNGLIFYRKIRFALFFISVYFILFIVNFNNEAINLVFQVIILFTSGLIVGYASYDLRRIHQLEFIFLMVFISLSGILLYEYFTQTKLFPIRSFYQENSEGFSVNLRKLSEDNAITLYSSFGPFGSNLQIAGPYLLIGFLAIARSSSDVIRFFLIFLFTLSLVAIQSRAAIFSMLFFYGIWFRFLNTSHRFFYIIAILSSFVTAFTFFGYSTVMTSIFYIETPFEFAFSFFCVTLIFGFFVIKLITSKRSIRFLIFMCILSLFLLESSNDDGASLAGRLFGFKLLFKSFLNWPFGTGPGKYALGLNESVAVFSDQGSLLIFFVETGFIGTFLLLQYLFVVFKNIYFQHFHIRAYILALIGILPYILFTISFDLWFVIIIYTVLIIRIKRDDLNELKEINSASLC